MLALLQPIAQIPGVTGVAALGMDGRCVAHILRPPYEPILIEEAVSELGSALDNYRGVEPGELNDVNVLFELGRFITRRGRTHSLATLCQPTTNLAMLGVAMNVALLKLAQEARPQPQPQMAANGHHPNVMAGSGSFQPSASYQPTISNQPPLDASGNRMNWSGSVSNAPVGAVGMQVMRHLLSVAMRYFGENARAVLEAELKRLGAMPHELNSQQFADLIRRTAARLPSDEMRREFMAGVLGDMR